METTIWFGFLDNLKFILFISADSHISEVYCYLYETFVPHSLDLTLTTVYFNAQGVPTVLTNVIQLPLRLIVKPCSPIKDADYKITISSNKPAVSLLDIFPGNGVKSYPNLDLKLFSF